MNPSPRQIDIRPQVAASVWPTPVQLLLLRAALSAGDDARGAWQEWRERADLHALDISSWNLLPLAWRNLTATGLQDAVLDECRGYYRFHWARNQLRLRATRAWVADWQARGVPVIVLKGTALLAGTYGDAGLRPMADTDLLVPWARAGEVAARLQAEGWRPQLDYLAWEQIRPGMQCSFGWQRGPDQLDLHWHVLHRCTAPEVTEAFWQQARPLRFDGLETLQLCPADTLLHVCSHGVQYSTQAPFRWLADAAWIMRRHGADLDWRRVVTTARRTGATLALRHGLDYAATELKLSVPAEVLADLRAHRGSWWERADYRRTIDPAEGGRWLRAWHLLRLLRRIGGRGPLTQRWNRMARFLCDRWESPSLGAAARLAVKKVLRGHRGTFATDRGKTRAP